MKQSYSFTGSISDQDYYSNVKTRLKSETLDSIKESIVRRKENLDNYSNTITTSIFFAILQENGFLLNEKVRQDLMTRFDIKQKVPLKSIMKVLSYALNEYPDVINENFNSDYIDAFVALGGSSDTTGSISIDNFKQVLQEFGLLVDIDALLMSNGIQGSEINYELFCKIFDKPIFEDNKSLHSYFTVN